MRERYSDNLLRMTARLYYIDGLGQADVARLVEVSQAKVSRLLALARRRGIVRISVVDQDARHTELERRIEARFKLKSVSVIKTVEGAGVERIREMVGHFSAPIVNSLVAPKSTVAISGGRTLRELIRLLPEDKDLRCTVLQAMGSIDAQVGPDDAFELGRIAANRWGGSFRTLNTPALVPDKKTRDAFLALEQIRSVLQDLCRASVALVGVGTLSNSVFVERGVLKSADLEQLRSAGAVGEICGRFFDAEGRDCDSSWRDRVIGIELDWLRKIPQVVAVVAGQDRTEAIQAAIRGKLIKTLIIDEGGAIGLVGDRPTGVRSNSNLRRKR